LFKSELGRLSEIDPSTNLSDALSELIAFDAQGRAIWPAKELTAKLDEPLEKIDQKLVGSLEIRTVRELLEHANPPMALLISLKDLSKRRPRDLFPPEMALLLYYGSIAAGMVRCGKKITKLPDEDLRNGFSWAIKEQWVPEKICELFRQGISKLNSGQNWRG
jgi:hypothetical protein